MANCTFIDGVASSQAIDTAGEIVDIAGLDCSSLIGAAFNYEHKSDVPAQIVGKVLEYKKIFSDKDCETDRQKYFWQKCQIPFLYVMGRLFDDKKDSSKEIAALFIDDAENPNEPKMLGFSIEGAKIDKNGMVITRSIARKVTLTNLPANKTCIAEMVPSQQTAPKDDIDSLFKGEIEFFSPNSKYLEFLKKKEENMKKDFGTDGGSFVGSQLAMGEKPKWNPKHSGSALHYNHPEHGTVSIIKNPTGNFDIKHNGSHVGSSASPQDAGSQASRHMASFGQKIKVTNNMPKSEEMDKALTRDQHGPAASTGHEKGVHVGTEFRETDKKSAGMSDAGYLHGIGKPGEHIGEVKQKHRQVLREMKGMPKPNLPKSEEMDKALEAGSGNVAPSKLVQGAALTKQNDYLSNFNHKRKRTSGMSGTSMTSISVSTGSGGFGSMGGAFSRSEKSKWLTRAEEEYQKWDKREKFRSFMQKRLPRLAMGEIDAIGMTIALKKSLKAEKSLSKMASSYYSKKESK